MPKDERRKIVVEGSGGFPFDMLRYDACYPATESDSALLDFHHDEKRKVELITHNWTAPTYARWDSFTWRVVDVLGVW